MPSFSSDFGENPYYEKANNMKSSENLNNKLRKNINGSFIQSASNNNDLYIVGNPQISFFKVVYRRHTNFTIDTVKQFITGYFELHPTNNTKSYKFHNSN